MSSKTVTSSLVFFRGAMLLIVLLSLSGDCSDKNSWSEKLGCASFFRINVRAIYDPKWIVASSSSSIFSSTPLSYLLFLLLFLVLAPFSPLLFHIFTLLFLLLLPPFLLFLFLHLLLIPMLPSVFTIFISFPFFVSSYFSSSSPLFSTPSSSNYLSSFHLFFLFVLFYPCILLLLILDFFFLSFRFIAFFLFLYPFLFLSLILFSPSCFHCNSRKEWNSDLTIL